MAKNPDIRQTEAWTESKMQMVSILTRKIRRVKVDRHFMNMDYNESQMEIHSLVSWFSTLPFQKIIFQDKSNRLCHLLLE